MNINLLPADKYLVVNKTILTEYDKKIIIAFYEPIMGAIPTSLYFSLWNDLDQNELFSSKLNHHHLMSVLKCDLKTIKKARESLEALGLLKSFIKTGDVNEYIYELFSPLSPSEFFTHPLLNIVLYSNVGFEEYDRLRNLYQKVKVDTKDYEEITKNLDEVYETGKYNININNDDNLAERTTNTLSVKERIDFDLLISSIPKGVINEKTFTKKTKELINLIAFTYNIDTMKMAEIVRGSLNEFGMIDKNLLRITARKMHQFDNNSLPTLIYRTQPEFLKAPSGDNSMRGKIIAMFENTSPIDFLRNKNRGVNPTKTEIKLIDNLLHDFELQPAVVNVLIDYVLRKNNNSLNSAYVETIAAQWKRANIKTASEAMEFAEKEHKKLSKKNSKNEVSSTRKKISKEPIWFNDKIEKNEITSEEEEELKELLKEFN